MGRVSGKVAVVTGGALGIGRAAAVMLAKEGAKVAVADVLEKEMRQAVAEITKAGGVADAWPLDVSDEAQVK